MRKHFFTFLSLLLMTPSASPDFLSDLNETSWTIFFDFADDDEFKNAQPHEFNPQKKYKKKPKKDEQGNGPEEPEAAPPRKRLQIGRAHV